MHPAPGRLADKFTRKLLFLILIPSVVIILLLAYHRYLNSSENCIRCHTDKTLLEREDALWAFTDPKKVESDSRHPNIECRDCHLGRGRTMDKEKAHSGMLKMLVVSYEGRLLKRKNGYPGPLRLSGDDLMFSLFPKIEVDGELYMLPDVRNILWHDRDPETLGFDPEIAKKTCGKGGCHPDELKQFRTTIMGRNYRQRTMKTWLKPYGPHNCGPSFADIPPPEVLKTSSFDYRNTEEIMKDLNVPFNKSLAEDKQKFCNVCHAGCLDCHYTPFKDGTGVHGMTRKPTALSCSGYGRGASTCHPGAMTSRRGGTYIGGDYSIPQGMPGDVHYPLGIQCVDCHPTGEKGMGDMERAATCQDCHIEAEESIKKGVHKDLLCNACHVGPLGGYQITIWGPGEVAGRENPFHKYSLYYGIQNPPIIMKDQKGRWMTVKVWPHSVGNIRSSVSPSGEIKFRWPSGETRDAYYVVGTFDDLPSNNKHLLWVEFQESSHPMGRSRSCESCHENETQRSLSEWEFYDSDGAEPFRGRHTIIADRKGLRFVDMSNTTPIKPLPGRRLEDFASWIYLKDRWVVPGDFSIKTDKKRYKELLKKYNLLKGLSEKVIEKKLNKKDRQRLKRLREEVFHNIQTGYTQQKRFDAFIYNQQPSKK